MNFEISQQVFDIHSNNNFHDNTSSGSRGIPCGRTLSRAVSKINITQPIVARQTFAKAPDKFTNKQ
jgi:hypothetical protein